MRLRNLGFKGKVLGVIGLSILVVSAFFSYQLISVKNVANGALQVVVSDIELVIKINRSSVYFKSEVQAWKDLLIRGKDPNNFAKYNNELMEFVSKTNSEIESIRPYLPKEATELADQFLKNNTELLGAYTTARDRYLLKDNFDLASADTMVKGKDRPVLKSLEQLTGLLMDRMKQSSGQTIQSGLMTSFIFASLIAVFMLGLGWIMINRTVKMVTEITRQLTEASDRVGLASVQLSTTSSQVSEAATKSVNSIESTGASAEGLTSLVTHNAESAKEAASIAQSNSVMADKGATEIARLIRSMEEISSSSKKIEAIINVIDDIAFQTNLLALNAAVEAARAGADGKGFAVVAEAVRSLSQRSAAASQDIAVLIKESVKQVEDGVKVADASSNVLKSILDSTKKVFILNQEISDGTTKQAQGITQINKAMNDLDKSIQTNVSGSEEVAKSSEELSMEAQNLECLVYDLNREILGNRKNIRKSA